MVLTHRYWKIGKIGSAQWVTCCCCVPPTYDLRLMWGPWKLSVFEPTCALCTVGSYASLSVCLSVCLSGLDQKYWMIIYISKSIRARMVKLSHISYVK